MREQTFFKLFPPKNCEVNKREVGYTEMFLKNPQGNKWHLISKKGRQTPTSTFRGLTIIAQ